MLRWLVFMAVISFSTAAFCGSSAIPYSLEVLSETEIVLGCARPQCFGWDPNTGQPASNDALFMNVNDHPDGFFRAGPQSRPPFNPNDSRNYQQQTANCEPNFGTQCGPNQWVSGIEAANTTIPQLLCCTFDPLSLGTSRGIATVHPGQIVIGGEVFENGVQSHFDYISSLQKVISPDGSVSYDVGIGRFSCPDTTVPLPEAIIHQAPPPPIQQPAPVYYQPQPTGYSYSSPSYYCFSGDSMVQLWNGEYKRMDALTKNDWVQTLVQGKTAYVPLMFWLHRVPTQKAEFINFILEDGNHLKITKDHYIYKANCTAPLNNKLGINKQTRITAKEVLVGDCLYTIRKEGSLSLVRVVNISTVIETGIYAPMTANGNIIVNGIYASCHSNVENHALQSTIFGWLDGLTSQYGTNALFQLPFGLESLLSIAEYVLPKNLAEFV